VRTGRFFELELRADAADLDRTINEVCTTLLANPVIESFTVEKAG